MNLTHLMIPYGIVEVSCSQSGWQDQPHTPVSKLPTSKSSKYAGFEHRGSKPCTVIGTTGKEQISIAEDLCLQQWKQVVPKKLLQKSRTSWKPPLPRSAGNTRLRTQKEPHYFHRLEHKAGNSQELARSFCKPWVYHLSTHLPKLPLECNGLFFYPPPKSHMSSSHWQTPTWNRVRKGILGLTAPSVSSARRQMWTEVISSWQQKAQHNTVEVMLAE